MDKKNDERQENMKKRREARRKFKLQSEISSVKNLLESWFPMFIDRFESEEEARFEGRTFHGPAVLGSIPHQVFFNHEKMRDLLNDELVYLQMQHDQPGCNVDLRDQSGGGAWRCHLQENLFKKKLNDCQRACIRREGKRFIPGNGKKIQLEHIFPFVLDYSAIETSQLLPVGATKKRKRKKNEACEAFEQMEDLVDALDWCSNDRRKKEANLGFIPSLFLEERVLGWFMWDLKIRILQWLRFNGSLWYQEEEA